MYVVAAFIGMQTQVGRTAIESFVRDAVWPGLHPVTHLPETSLVSNAQAEVTLEPVEGFLGDVIGQYVDLR